MNVVGPAFSCFCCLYMLYGACLASSSPNGPPAPGSPSRHLTESVTPTLRASFAIGILLSRPGHFSFSLSLSPPLRLSPIIQLVPKCS